jgi:hypothetical protein
VRSGRVAARLSRAAGYRWLQRYGIAATTRQVRYRPARYHLSGGRPGPKPMLGRRLNQAMLTRLYDEGLTCAQIGERFGASAESIRALLAAYGIRRRTSGRRKRTAPAAPPPGMRKCPMSERAAEAIATARNRVAEARRGGSPPTPGRYARSP